MSTSFALYRKANQIAQSNPELAAELRLRAFEQKSVIAAVVVTQAAPVISRAALFSKANSIAQAKPQVASQMRFQAAYA
ncbi:MAG: hypothetical protein Q7T66_15685 [Herminiimonas sp.]|uniref:hypothetical protein n=1 Tax=Herminiimonas sp. TaxID=1926289 RepID=UPI0027240CDA|nr:hypothetical protein [Herminiimonas sp.]MDO9422103.1 hypothetical protein [Herminiimonas sp.]